VRRKIFWLVVILIIVFMGWRFLRPMQIFIVSPEFERPTDTSKASNMFPTLRAKECAACHGEFYDEWSTTIHSQAWTDPYFQTDWQFDGSAQICKNCHIPLDRQQEFTVVGFNDAEKWDPVLKPNPKFDAKLQHEGVTCNVCHFSSDKGNGKILGVLGNTSAPHPVEKLESGNQICVRCHVVSGKRWDTFFKFPPCGTVAEIQSSLGKNVIKDSSEMSVKEIAALGCVDCHMPTVQRPLVPGGKPRTARQHLWRGGHDPAMVKKGLTITLKETGKSGTAGTRSFTLSITNTGAAHYIPTGTPDRHLTVKLRALTQQGEVVKERNEILKRTVMWRPFIIDLWDTRLRPKETREYSIELSKNMLDTTTVIDARVDYHLLDESRRQRINYLNKQPIHYPVFQQHIQLNNVIAKTAQP